MRAGQLGENVRFDGVFVVPQKELVHVIRELLLAHIVHSLVDAHLVIEGVVVSAHPTPVENVLVAQCRPHSVVESADFVGALRVPIDQGQHIVEHLRSSRQNLLLFGFLSFLLLSHDLPRELCVKVNLLLLPVFIFISSSFGLLVV